MIKVDPNIFTIKGDNFCNIYDIKCVFAGLPKDVMLFVNPDKPENSILIKNIGTPAMKKVKKVYIAGAYTGATKEERDLNIAHVAAVGREVARKKDGGKKFPVMPHMNSARFEDCAPDIPEEFWLEGDIALMLSCDAVVFIEGWERSPGAVAEMEAAKKAKMVIYRQTFVRVYPDEEEGKESGNEGL